MFNLDQHVTTEIVANTLHNADGGELFLERNEVEVLTIENGILKSNEFSVQEGFGFRSFIEDRTTFFHSAEINKNEILKASTLIKSNHQGQSKTFIGSQLTHSLYSEFNPIDEMAFQEKVSLLKTIDSYIHKNNTNVKKSAVTLSGSLQTVEIIRKDGKHLQDIRPLVRLNVVVILEKDGKIEQGYYGAGGRNTYAEYIKDWKSIADKAIRQATINLDARPTPAGEMTVVLGSGWPGILLHEAIGHGLEGDFNRKKTSAFSELVGKRVASEGIVVVDDGTIKNGRGSINIDDEGNPSQYNVLIEDGILSGYMHDCLNANLMGASTTGNGRRESYAHLVLPRMTNTYMLPGQYTEEEIIKSVDNGLYAVSFGGGQVDITSGKFVFLASEAYMIENGQVTYPVRGATLIGNGPDALTKISMVGNDLKLDSGIGTCSKDGQNLPVGVGQPTLKIDSIIVGGTESKS